MRIGSWHNSTPANSSCLIQGTQVANNEATILLQRRQQLVRPLSCQYEEWTRLLSLLSTLSILDTHGCI